MSNIFEDTQFKFFLDFNNSFGSVEITEPIGFDACSFTLTQESSRYGRDIEYSSEDLNLEFRKISTTITQTPITLPNGVIIDRLTMGLDYLLETDNLTGFESDCKFRIQKNGVNFVIGNIDFSERETDGLTYFRAKIIQNTDKAILKRRFDVKVDLRSDKGLDDNIVYSPIPTKKALLKSKPIQSVSTWRNDKEYNFTEGLEETPVTMFNYGVIQDKYDIKDSYIPFSADVKGTGAEIEEDFVQINVKERMVNTKITFKIDATFVMTQGTLEGQGFIQLLYGYGYDIPTPLSLLYEKYWNSDEPPFTYVLNDTFEVEIPLMEAGMKLWFVGVAFGNADCDVSGTIREWNLKVETTSISIDSVIDVSRHIDVFRNTAEKVCNFEVIAPKYAENGIFYDNYVFNGYMLRQSVNKPMTTSIKDVLEQLQELNSDYQVLPNKRLFIGQYEDFYPNRDIGAFLQVPNTDFEKLYNERYLFQTFEYKYENFEQDKNEKDTIDAVHTEAQFMTPNNQIEGVKEVSVPYTRDPFQQETLRRENLVSTNTDKTSLSSDDNFFINEFIPIPEESYGVITNSLNFLVSNDPQSTIKILAPENTNWLLLGIELGDIIKKLTIKVSDTQLFTYSNSLEVIAIESGMITLLSNIAFDPVELGNHTDYVEMEYYYTSVDLIVRTNEGFDLIENVESPDNFSNLAYTIRRNMMYWESYIKTGCNYKLEGVFKNTYWKSNGELITKLNSEAETIKENESVVVTTLRQRILTPVIYKTVLTANFYQVLDVIEKLNTVYENGTIGGFIRIKDLNDRVVKGYAKEIKYNWSTCELSVIIEEKFESDYINIIRLSENKGYIINEVGYDEVIIGKSLRFKANGDYIQLFDNIGIPITNPKNFKFVSINGINFQNVELTCKAISEL